MADLGDRTLRIVWAAMLMATLVYSGLALSGVVTPAHRIDIPLLPILALVAAGSAVTAVVLRGRLAGSGIGAQGPIDPEARVRATIVPWALDESIAVYGYVLYLTGHRPIEWLPFMVVGFAMLLLHAPRNANES